MFATIDALRESLAGPMPAPQDPVYAAKMLHTIPVAPSVDRVAFVLDRVTGKRVLEFGASGLLHDAVKSAAAGYLGVDRSAADQVVAWDLDDVSRQDVPAFDAPELILCGEMLEHLSNPGWFLTRVARQYPGVPVLITTPNAFTSVGRSHLARGLENVNIDHACWFSWRTLITLLTRAGLRVQEFCWYGGKPIEAQGLIVVCVAESGQ